MTLQPARLAKACAALGVEFDWIGQEGRESADPRGEMRACDIVFASGRSALEAMAAGRAVVVVEEGGVSGWVSEPSYAELEADGFTGLDGEPQQDLELLLGQYSQDLGTQARSLVVRHHAAQHHAAALVEIYTAVADTAPTAVAPESLGLLVQDRFALEAPRGHRRVGGGPAPHRGPRPRGRGGRPACRARGSRRRARAPARQDRGARRPAAPGQDPGPAVPAAAGPGPGSRLTT